MAGELIIKNGLRVSGSIMATAGLTGSFSGSISNATTASYALTASVLLGSVTSASFAATSSFPWFPTGSNIAYIGGNVGIGTTGPSSKLHVWNSKVQVTGFPTSGSPFTFLQSDYNNASVTVRFLNVNPTNGLDADLGIQLSNTSNVMTDVMRIKGSTGNVGIGTTSPAERLEISGSLKFTTNSTISATGTLYLSPSTAQTYINYADRYLLVDGWTNSYVSLIAETGNPLEIRSGANTNQLHLTTGGNVGVGTASSTYRLQVRGSGTTSSTGAFRVENANASASLVVTDDGRVSINNTAFSTVGQKLEVLSNIAGPIAGFGARSTSAPMSYTISGDNNWNIIGSNMYFSASAYYHVFIDRYGVFHKYSPQGGTTSAAYSIELIPITGSVGPVASSVAFQVLNNGNIGIGTTAPSYKLDISGSGNFTNNLTVTGSIIATSLTGSLLGTASYWSGSILNTTSASFATTASYWSGSILNATSASYALSSSFAVSSSRTVSSSFASTASYWSGSILNATSASFASTASSVNTLNQNVLITGSLTVGLTSLGNAENTLVIGPAPNGGAGEGGQILLAAQGGPYTSASMLDTYQDQFRILRGTNAGSDAFKLQVNLHTGQLQIPNYNSSTAFLGAPVANLSSDNSGNVITVAGYSGIVTINTMPPVNFDIQNGIIVNVF